MPPSSPLRSDPVDDRYAADVAAALRRAEKSHAKARRALERAEQAPRRSERGQLATLRAEVERRHAELRELEQQMQQVPGLDGSGRTGARKSARSVTPKGTKL